MGSISEPLPQLAETWDLTQKAPTKNLSALLLEVAEKYPGHTALKCLRQQTPTSADSPSWTFDQLNKESLKLASLLSSKGVRSGSYVVAILLNEFEWALFFWATAHLGCQFVALDPRAFSRQEDARFLLAKTPASAIVASNKTLASIAADALSHHNVNPVVRCITGQPEDMALPSGWEALEDLLQSPMSDFVPKSLGSPNDPAIVFFTSGTSGSPKACPQTSVNIASAGLGFAKRLELNSSHTVCQHLPSFHVFSVAMTMAVWLVGGSIVFPSPTFDPNSSIVAVEQGQNVVLPCVPLMLKAIVNVKPASTQFKSLDSVILGGAPIFPEALEMSKSLGPKRVIPGFGMTEGVITLLNVMEAGKARPSITGEVSIGTVASGSCIRICAPGTRQILRRGEIGELHQGGLPVFGGYLGLDDESAYQEDGVNFLASGDQAYMDDLGNIYMMGRYKDIIIRGGENISPAKIENWLQEKRGISAQVVGIPDDLAGEVPVAIVQNFTTTKASLEELHATIVSELGAGFAPSMLLHLQSDLGQESFPTTASGKIQKAIVRQWTLNYMKNSKPAELSSGNGTVESQLAVFWATLSGRSETSIQYDVSVHTFADSMMLIQFCSLVADKMRKKLTVREVFDAKTINCQAEILRGRPEMNVTNNIIKAQGHSEETLLPILQHSQAGQNRLASIKEHTTAQLTAMGVQWSDVEDVLPMTDSMTVMSRGARLNSYNHRHSLVVNSTNIPDLRRVLRTWLGRHPLLRSTVGTDGSEVDFHLIMSPTDAWFHNQLLDGEMIDRAEDLTTYRMNDREWDYVCPTGPMTKATLFPIRDSSDVGIVFHFHHAIFDGLILKRWYLDLEYLLSGQTSPLSFCPYQEFTGAFYLNRHGPSAEEGVDFHVQRLRGISSSSQNLWPVQRAPMWMKGNDWDWKHENGEMGRPGERVLLDGDEAIGTCGMNRSTPVPNMRKLREEFSIAPPIIAKAACALFNLHTMNCDEAVFASVESGRSWPFIDAESEPNSNPLTIDGPTMNETINRIRVAPGETVHQFLDRLQEDQLLIDMYSHAPVASIHERLAVSDVIVDGEGKGQLSDGSADAKTFLSCLPRQIFDWLPPVRPLEQAGNIEPRVRALEILGRTDLGIVWFPSLIDDNVLNLDATWDDAQLRSSEVYKAMSEFMYAIVWLSDPSNLNRPVVECEFDIPGYDITDIEPWGNRHR
ncbi:Nonribosomal peptide synthetases (NRPS) [Penicillium pulvis]|uniref:Nonribosomal peptide synthetases (NRPS) n=1 Tax=Penicillium pulvis TaxID=1562058 RepID=UPI00254745E7|nr:Nonribosomal peptide synthetases (NRPS) [Penicillium pulvis]KAJ5802192.1 Nonribosomal peptide synthetases (NRPS) [Penicillium pulvis]